MEALAGLEGAEQARAAVLQRAASAAGRDAVVAQSGDTVLVLAAPPAAARVHAAASAAVRLVDLDGGTTDVRLQLRAGTATGSADLALLRTAAAAAARTAAPGEVVPADPALVQAAADRRRLERLLRTAVADDLLRLHYQPLVDLTTGAVVGAEALVRLQDGDVLVPPADLVPVAEQTGLIVEIGTWVLREACRRLAAWQQRYPSLATVAVNVSAFQVCRPDFADVVLDAVRSAGVAPGALVLELTESVVLDAGPVAVQQLHRLRAAGVSTGVDDFGTGYASLSGLRSLPVAFLKVDRSFVDGLPASASDTVVVRAVLDLARDLGLACVVEGIETADQLAAVQAFGAVQGQGFLLSRPVPEDAFEQTLSGSLLPGAEIRLPGARSSPAAC